MSDPPLRPAHLSDEQLAAFIDGALLPAERSDVESHVADCAVCRAELVAASRLVADAPAPARGRRVPWLGIAAAAAVAFTAVSRFPIASEPAAVRANTARSDSAISVVTPTTKDVVKLSDVRFVWRAMPTIMEYSITVQDPDGHARWSARTADTAVALPDSVRLTAGSVLHWYVDGLTADGRSVSTGRQRLEVR